MLLLACASLHAQSWAAPGEGAYNSETVVYATLTTNLNASPRSLVVAAFIDDDCRASVTPSITPKQTYLYEIRVQGDRDDDNGKPITFKVYDPKSGNEYVLACAQAITFNNATYGYPSGSVELTLTAATSYTLNFTEAEVGKDYDVASYLTVEPQGAAIPENVTWSISLVNDPNGDPSSYASLKGTTLQGIAPYMNGINLTLSVPDPTGAPGVTLASSVFNVVQYATAINLLREEVTVNRESLTLSGFMSAGVSYAVEPSTTTDNVLWETDDASILEWNQRGYFIPIQAGTAHMRPYIIKKDGTKLVPADEKWITVTVVVPVTSIKIDYSKYNEQFKANVGDTHLYERLANIINIAPADATDKSFTISVENESPVSLIGATTLTATSVGSAFVTVMANGADPQNPVSERVQIDVVDPTTTANIASNQIVVALTDGNPQDISTEVQNNVTLATAGGSLVSEVDGTVELNGRSVTCSPAPGLDLGGITGVFTAVAEGTTTVNINLRWPNYDTWGVTTDELQYNSNQYSFSIVVTNSLTLTHFDVAIANPVAGQGGSIILTPQPAGATFDINELRVDINNGLAGSWANTLTSSFNSATETEIVYDFTSTIPGQVNVSVMNSAGVLIPLNDPGSPVGNSFTGFEVGWPFELSTGWQWRSNPCGFIPANELATYYGDGDLIEIRTNNSLLYNDPEWGFYGTLTSTPGILQGQCYKVNMKSARYTVLMGSSVTDEATQVAGTVNMTNDTYTVTLKPGWNWVGSPYLFDRELSNVFNGQTANLSGAVIIGKTGSAELSSTTGLWTGNLTALMAGEGYIIKNPGNSNIELTFPNERAWEPANEGNGAGVKGWNMAHSVWEYDHTRFMNNMTMVAELEGIDQPEQYSIGAFVGDECRGEGVIIDGKAFITVHCDAGEYVTFQLYNTCTGEYSLVDEGMKAQTRVGSLKTPFRMHANIADGISNIAGEADATETYDLSGRRTSSQQRGVALRRMTNGTVRKVVVK